VVLLVDTNAKSAVSSTIIGREEAASVGTVFPRKEQTERERPPRGGEREGRRRKWDSVTRTLE
jgi:hypothetical protein